MLSFADTCPWIWRQQMLTACTVKFNSNQEAFAEAAHEWSAGEGIAYREDELSSYRESLRRKGQKPFVSQAFRQYAAHVLELKVEDDPPNDSNSESPKQRATMRAATRATVVAAASLSDGRAKQAFVYRGRYR